MNQLIPPGPPAFILWSYSLTLCAVLLASLSIVASMRPEARRFAVDPLPGKKSTRFISPVMLVGLSATLAFAGNLMLLLKIVLHATSGWLDLAIMLALFLSGLVVFYFVPRVIYFILQDQLNRPLGGSPPEVVEAGEAS